MDFNPGGVAIWFNYMFGSVRAPESHEYAVAVEWIAITQRVIEMHQLQSCYVTLKDSAQKKLASLAKHPILSSMSHIQQQIKQMQKYGSIEIEAIQNVHGYEKFLDIIIQILMFEK